MRKQYHFRPSKHGFYAWDIDRLVRLTERLEPRLVRLEDIQELDEPFWFGAANDKATCREVVEHAKLMAEADTAYPIILSSDGRVMDGMHRVCRALFEGQTTIQAVRFSVDPEPDYEDVYPDDLPYQSEQLLQEAVETTPAYSGRCLCGAIIYRADAPPRFSINCYCRECQRSSGSAFVPGLYFERQRLSIDGEVKYFDSTSESGNIFSRGFCPKCGSTLFGRSSGYPDLVAVRAGSLDRPESYEPKINIFVAEAPSWGLVEGRLETFDRDSG